MNLKIFIIAYLIILIIGVYILKLPDLITKEYKLVEEFYYSKSIKYFLIDFIACLIYIFIIFKVIELFKINNLILKIIICCSVTVTISSIFHYIFKKINNQDMFFVRWFNSAGHKATLYDIIIVLAMFLLYTLLDKYL